MYVTKASEATAMLHKQFFDAAGESAYVRLYERRTRELRQQMESAFSPYMPDAHTTPSAILDMFPLERSLLSSKLAAPRPEADLHGKYFDSTDTFGAGMETLASRVSAFNREHVCVRGRRSYPMSVERDAPSLSLTPHEEWPCRGAAVLEEL